ncbi:MAG: DUF6178 family protein [Myxococcota bacterium]
MSRTLPPMPDPSAPARAARRILALAGSDRTAARKALERLEPEAQVALVCESPISLRAGLLGLVSHPEEVIPRMPPAELCFVVKAVGLSDAGWLLEHASAEQITTAIDLDAWSALVPDRGRIGAWLDALRDAGEETLLRAAHALDFELLALELRSRVSVIMSGRNEDVDLPSGALTLDGQFHVVPSKAGDDLEDVLTLLRVLFQHDYWFYHRLLQAVSADLEHELEEWALRWRNGRLQDLGFPQLEDAKRIYAWLSPERLAELPSEPHAIEVGEWPLPVWMPSLPVAGEGGELLFRSIAALREEERRPLLFAFLALANRLAVADGLPLGDVESLPQAIAKAEGTASRGLAYLAQKNGVEPTEVLRRATLERLFMVGSNIMTKETGR